MIHETSQGRIALRHAGRSRVLLDHEKKARSEGANEILF
jgi:hypothetical protein